MGRLGRNLSNLDEGRVGGRQVWMNDRLDDISIPWNSQRYPGKALEFFLLAATKCYSSAVRMFLIFLYIMPPSSFSTFRSLLLSCLLYYNNTMQAGQIASSTCT